LKNGLKVLFAASEVSPFAKVGGLADVAGSLPAALNRLGCDVRVFAPLYNCVGRKEEMEKVTGDFSVRVAGTRFEVSLKMLKRDGVIHYFADIPGLFDRDEIYGCADDVERWIAFCHAALVSLQHLGWKPEIAHCNDWQTALLPALLKTTLATDPFYGSIASVFTIHNLAYQGVVHDKYVEAAGLPRTAFDMNTMEFYGGLNFMKTGITYADAVNTVSPGYRREILTPRYGERLNEHLAANSHKLYGILNGIDEKEFDPSKDRRIEKRYAANRLSGKEKNRQWLRERLGLEREPKGRVPLAGMVTRVTDQKGFDILGGAIKEMMGCGMQIVVLGEGDPKYEKMLRSAQEKWPGEMSFVNSFDPVLAQRIYAGSDMFLMPSKFEPCGLGQMIALRYGTLPVARAVGGLADTIVDYSSRPDHGTGFLFDDYSAAGLMSAVLRAVAVYQDRAEWRRIVGNAMHADFSWDRSSGEYYDLYHKALENSSRR